ncbi:MAG: MFS transporter [Planctomycetes bacterium]|nr:MFS transporter [Planctomycetota bacterium]
MSASTSPLAFLREEAGYRRLWVATATSELGSIVARVAFLLLVNERALRAGGAPESAAALMLMAETLAMVVFGPVAGGLVDRFDRRRLLIGSNCLQAALAASVPFVARLETQWPIYALAMAISAVSTVFPPARQSAIPDLVGLERAPIANSISSSTTSFVIVVGAAAAAVLLGAFDKDACFFTTTVAFLLAALAIAGLALPRHLADEHGLRALLRDIEAGFAHVRRAPPIAYVVLCYFVSFLFIGLWLPIMPEYLRRHVGVDPDVWLPRTYLAFGIGGIAGGLLGPWIGRRLRVGRAVVLTFFLEPVLMATYGLPWSVWPLMSLSFAWGLLAFAYFVQEHTVLQQDVPAGLRGRVFGMLPPLQALGTLVASALVWWEAGRIPPGHVMLYAGVGYMAASATFLLLFRGGRQLWRRPNLVEA